MHCDYDTGLGVSKTRNFVFKIEELFNENEEFRIKMMNFAAGADVGRSQFFLQILRILQQKMKICLLKNDDLCDRCWCGRCRC